MTSESAAHAASVTSTPKESGSRKIVQHFRSRFQTHKDSNVIPSGSVAFDKSEFVIQEGTGAKDKKSGNVEAGRKNPEKVYISKELMGQYTTFLGGHMKRLLDLSNSTAHRHLLDLPEHHHEQRLIEQLAEKDPHSNKFVLSQEKLKKFIETPEGLRIAVQLEEEQTTLRLFALGLDLEARNTRDARQRAPQNRLLNIGVNDETNYAGFGRLAYIAGYNVLGRMQGLGASIVGGLAGGEIGRALGMLSRQDLNLFMSSLGEAVQNPTLIGAAVGATTYGAIARSFFKPEGNFDQHRSADALTIIQTDPNAIEYIKAMTGIDANDFEVNNGRVRLSPTRLDPARRREPGSIETFNIDQSINSVIQNLRTRRSFYKELGFPEGRRRRPTEPLLTRYPEGNVRQIPTKWAARIQEIVQPNDPAFQALPIQDRIRAYQNARLEVLNEELTDYINLIEGGRDTAGEKEALQKRVDRAKDKSTWESEHTARKTAVESDSRTLKGVQESLKAKPLPEVEAQAATRDKTIKERDDVLKELTKIDRTATGLGDISRLIAAAEGKITAARTEIENIAARMKAEMDAVHANPDLRTKKYGTVEPIFDKDGNKIGDREKPASYREIQQEIKAIFGFDSEKQETIIAKQEELIARLEGIQSSLESKDKVLSGMPVPEANEPLRDIHKSFNIMLQAGSTALTPVTSADLANDAITTDALLERINEAHGRGTFTGLPGEPWPAEQNELHREMLVKARIEAKMRQNALTFAPAQERALQQLMHRTLLDEGQIAKMSEQDITEHMIRLYNANPRRFTSHSVARVTSELIASAKEAATLRASHRDIIISQMIQSHETAAKLIDAESRHFVEPENVRRGEIILDLANRQKDIYTNSTDPELHMVDMFDDTDATGADHLTEEEIALQNPAAFVLPAPQIPRGYYNTIDFLFDYQHRGDARGSYFEKIQSVLNPQRFTEIFEEGLMNGEIAIPGVWIPAGGFDIHTLFQELHAAFDNNFIGQIELRQIGTYFIDQLLEEGQVLVMH